MATLRKVNNNVNKTNVNRYDTLTDSQGYTLYIQQLQAFMPRGEYSNADIEHETRAKIKRLSNNVNVII